MAFPAVRKGFYADFIALRNSAAAEQAYANIMGCGAFYTIRNPCQAVTGFTRAAAFLAAFLASDTPVARAKATPILRFAKASGLPNKRSSLPGTAKASATPSKATALASKPP